VPYQDGWEGRKGRKGRAGVLNRGVPPV
jgi:hypothetical protein